jgi:outer membrane protein assembly factor BamB
MRPVASPIGTNITRIMLLATALAVWPAMARAADWTQWCGKSDRNMVSAETGLPDRFDETTGASTDSNGLQNVKWVVRLGGGAYGSPIVAGGKVYIGGDVGWRSTGMLWCFREEDGKMLWRMRSVFCKNLVNQNWGICCTPTVEGDRVYVMGNMGEVLCLDANGLAGRAPSQTDLDMLGADRELLKSEIAPDGRRILECSPGTPGVSEPTDAHVLWRFDMVRDPEVNCWPFNAQSAAIVVRGDRLYVATGSVYSEHHSEGSRYWIEKWKEKYGKARYDSPCLIVLDKNTGKLLATDQEGIFEQVFHGAHASPAVGVVGGKELLFYGAGNGTCYAFDPDFTPGESGKRGVLKSEWKFNCLAPATYDAAYKGPRLDRAEIIATPVFYKDRIYVSIGNDLQRSGGSAGPGRLLCLDATKTGDITASGKIWSFDDIHSTSSTVAIADGLVYTADAAGNIYCLDADTGKVYWQHKTSAIWASPLVADGKVYVPANGLLVFAAGKEKKLLSQSKGSEQMAPSPAAANGVLYVANNKFLYALQQGAVGSLNKALSPWSPPEADGFRRHDDSSKLKPAVVAASAGAGAVAIIVAALIWRRKAKKARIAPKGPAPAA